MAMKSIITFVFFLKSFLRFPQAETLFCQTCATDGPRLERRDPSVAHRLTKLFLIGIRQGRNHFSMKSLMILLMLIYLYCQTFHCAEVSFFFKFDHLYHRAMLKLFNLSSKLTSAQMDSGTQRKITAIKL